MLLIKDKGKFLDQIAKLDDASMASLQSKLMDLLTYGSNAITVELYYTHSENEYGIVWLKDNVPWMWGGLVNHDGKWGIHT